MTGSSPWCVVLRDVFFFLSLPIVSFRYNSCFIVVLYPVAAGPTTATAATTTTTTATATATATTTTTTTTTTISTKRVCPNCRMV